MISEALVSPNCSLLCSEHRVDTGDHWPTAWPFQFGHLTHPLFRVLRGYVPPPNLAPLPCACSATIYLPVFMVLRPHASCPPSTMSWPLRTDDWDNLQSSWASSSAYTLSDVSVSFPLVPELAHTPISSSGGFPAPSQSNSSLEPSSQLDQIVYPMAQLPPIPSYLPPWLDAMPLPPPQEPFTIHSPTPVFGYKLFNFDLDRLLDLEEDDEPQQEEALLTPKASGKRRRDEETVADDGLSTKKQKTDDYHRRFTLHPDFSPPLSIASSTDIPHFDEPSFDHHKKVDLIFNAAGDWDYTTFWQSDLSFA